ncbi:MFS transporter [Immundisolibacter cernigliae]|uniref:MFS transporter n=1 Tax=Immundisolibacter cernigliae TaxID=1810504 RepID=UPI00083ACB8C|nr:MFS transporter [Immundisolibacter cernigliae]
MLRALRHRNFKLFFFGQLLSLPGTWIQMVAQSWLIYRLTDSAVLLGLAGFASQFPVFLIAPLGGALADRFSRHRLLIGTQVASAVLALSLAALTLSGQVEVWHVFTLASLLGVVNGFDLPARQAFTVQLVGREDLPNAIALNSSAFNAARLVGPAVAGVLVAAAGEGWCFLLNGVSYATVLAALLAMRLTPTEKPIHTGSMLEHIVDGIRYVRGHLPIRSLLLLLGMVSLAGMPYAVLMPVFADRILHGGPQGLGILMSCAGGGALVGALLLAARRSPRGLGGWVPWAAFGFGLGLVGFSLSRNFWLSGVLLVPTGFAMMVQMAASNTLLQMMVPDALRGRVMSLYSMMFMGMAPLGSLLAGSLAEVIGAPGTVAGGGALCMLAALWFRRRLPQIRGAIHGMGGAGPGAPAADGRGAQPVDNARRPEPQSGAPDRPS